jgi:hypothetical protein
MIPTPSNFDGARPAGNALFRPARRTMPEQNKSLAMAYPQKPYSKTSLSFDRLHIVDFRPLTPDAELNTGRQFQK